MCNAALTAMSPAPPLCCLPELLDLLILYAPPSLSCDHSSFLQKKLDLTLDQMTTRSRSCFQITRVGDLFLHLGQLSLFYSQNVSWDWSDLAQIGSDAITCYEDKASARQYKEVFYKMHRQTFYFLQKKTTNECDDDTSCSLQRLDLNDE